MASNEPASVKEQFDLLYSLLRYYTDSAMESAFKVTGFLVLVTGWVMTSDNARAILGHDPVSRWTAVVTVLFAAGMFAGIAIRVLRQSQLTLRQLRALDYMSIDYYQEQALTPKIVTVFVAVDVVLSITLCVFILRL